MKKAVVALALLLSVALVVPLAAQGKAHALRIRIQPPGALSAPTHACPLGTLHYHLSSNGATGSGSNCLKEHVPVHCPPHARLCRDVRSAMTLRLPGGTIKGHARILEVNRCDNPLCTTLADDHRWSGTVTRATHRFHKLRGASVSGGGLVVLNKVTLELFSVHEVLTINHGRRMSTLPNVRATNDPPDPIDPDGDGVPDRLDNCPFTPNPGIPQDDADDDSVGNVCDNCPSSPNTDQRDVDRDGVGDECAPGGDFDGDGVDNSMDNCVRVANAGQQDGDQDRVGDTCDPFLRGRNSSWCGQGALKASGAIVLFCGFGRRRARARSRRR